jgi:hypothetical protein
VGIALNVPGDGAMAAAVDERASRLGAASQNTNTQRNLKFAADKHRATTQLRTAFAVR